MFIPVWKALKSAPEKVFNNYACTNMRPLSPLSLSQLWLWDTKIRDAQNLKYNCGKRGPQTRSLINWRRSDFPLQPTRSGFLRPHEGWSQAVTEMRTSWVCYTSVMQVVRKSGGGRVYWESEAFQLEEWGIKNIPTWLFTAIHQREVCCGELQRTKEET